ncbi:MAG TPA: hypothetical protein VJB66_01635 [Candidatus Nanoarchaeia archaeon]|nr:hypothetical protein [Candidatus Nanoarchaeia archaeon]
MNRENFTYVLAFVSLFATLAGLFSEKYRVLVAIGGFTGLFISLAWLKSVEYITLIQQTASALNAATSEIERLKREFSITKKMFKLVF